VANWAQTPEAGHYTYEFLDVGDAVYVGRSMKHKNLALEQDVKPQRGALH
jgi:nucleoporin POM152